MGTCENCRWWDQFMQYKPDDSHNRRNNGLCRVKSPGDTRWPITGKDDWCGEWTGRPEGEGK